MSVFLASGCVTLAAIMSNRGMGFGFEQGHAIMVRQWQVVVVGWLIAVHPMMAVAAPSRLDDLAPAVAALRTLPDADARLALAVHATPEGHWQFVNAAGETYTAGTPDELKRAASIVLPNSSDGFASATVILSQASLFVGAVVLKDLPRAKAIKAVIGTAAYTVTRNDGGALTVQVRPNVVLPATAQPMVIEALAQLHRPLDGPRHRLFSLATGGAASLPAAPKFDAKSGAAAFDVVDPDHVAQALKSVRGQTVLLTAKIDGDALVVQPPSGASRRLDWRELSSTAKAADVDLMVLDCDPPLQPGNQTWFWQRLTVAGLDTARKRSTLADFLDQLAAGRGVFAVAMSLEGEGRVAFTARMLAPESLTTGAVTGAVTGWLKDQISGQISGQVTGALQPTAVRGSLVSDARRRQLEGRLFGWLPSIVLIPYLAALAMGAFAWPVLRPWWNAVWPMELLADYDGTRGYALARATRAVVFIVLFVPLAAVPALVVRVFSRRRAPNAA
jgi:hypothetical protein